MLSVILAFISILILIKIASKVYKDCEKLYQKIVVIIYTIIVLSPAIILILDLSDIPSKIFNDNKIDIQNWIGYIMSYLGSVVAGIIGAVAGLWMTLYQIKENNKDNEKRDKENLRIQNMPLLKYEITTASKGKTEKDNIETIFSKSNDKMHYLNIDITNFGLGCIKDIVVKIESDVLNTSPYLIDNKSYKIINKEECVSINKNLYLERGKSYKFILSEYYEDLLNNWYSQKIEIDYLTKETAVTSLIVKKEVLLEENDQNLKEIFNNMEGEK